MHFGIAGYHPLAHIASSIHERNARFRFGIQFLFWELAKSGNKSGSEAWTWTIAGNGGNGGKGGWGQCA